MGKGLKGIKEDVLSQQNCQPPALNIHAWDMGDEISYRPLVECFGVDNA